MDETPSGGHERTLTVSSGPRARREVPLAVAAPAGAAEGEYVLEGAGDLLRAQIAHGRLLAILPALSIGEVRTYTLRPSAADPLAVAESTPAGVTIGIGGADFVTLRLEGAPKPFLHPLFAPGGTSVVRGWPVEPSAGDTTDHVHHRGVWIGHGDVNGADAWEEHAERLGRIAADEVDTASGAVCAHVALNLRWLLPGGRVATLERRLHRFWAVDGQVRLLDIESTYSGARGAWVRFGDTKEGALCGVRVATGMEGSRGGRITTAEGAVGEREAWGSAAGWCDYSGVPDGRRTGTVGVAIFDHPGNPLHPTRWHVRDYGLMTANPFALSHYLPGSGLQGDWLLPAGQSATFRFRLCVHRGDADAAEVARRYADWAFPPQVRWAQG